jgi:adenylate kinase
VRVVIMGAPGAGKGTQAQRLATYAGAAHVSTGDMLREAVQSGSPLGREARRYLDAGLLVPDDIVIGIVEERLGRTDCDDGFILDGFPRTLDQARALDAMLKRLDCPIDAVVHMDVPREEAMRRLAGRRTCAGCGSMFHVVFAPPQQDGRCDRCGGALVQRDDDREDTVARRMDVYTRQTAPVLDHYRAAGLLRVVPGTGDRDAVFTRLATAVGAGEGRR